VKASGSDRSTGVRARTAPLGRELHARAVRYALLNAPPGPGRGRGVRWLLVGLWLVLDALVVVALLAVSQPAPDTALADQPPTVQRRGPAEDDDVDATALALLAARLVALAPLEETAPADPNARPALAPGAAPPGAGRLTLATGGPPLALRTAPDRAAPALVQVPDGAALEDLGEMTPDGAWQRVGWAGWEGWIAAGLLRKQ
jgi:hypothetical protein